MKKNIVPSRKFEPLPPLHIEVDTAQVPCHQPHHIGCECEVRVQLNIVDPEPATLFFPWESGCIEMEHNSTYKDIIEEQRAGGMYSLSHMRSPCSSCLNSR